jgi:hypothetical protein
MNRILSGNVFAIFRHRDLQACMPNRRAAAPLLRLQPKLASAATEAGFGFRNPFAGAESWQLQIPRLEICRLRLTPVSGISALTELWPSG